MLCRIKKYLNIRAQNTIPCCVGRAAKQIRKRFILIIVGPIRTKERSRLILSTLKMVLNLSSPLPEMYATGHYLRALNWPYLPKGIYVSPFYITVQPPMVLLRQG